MDKEWFEQNNRVKNDINKNVWVPLRASRKVVSEGEYGQLGYKEEYFGAGSIIISVEDIDKALGAEWMDFGISRDQKGNPYNDVYEPAHLHIADGDSLGGEFIIVSQSIGGEHCDQWHISPDLISTLELLKEGDLYLAYDRGYEEVIKLRRNENGCIDEILIKSKYLKDYLSARNMALLVSSYSSRTYYSPEKLEVDWNLEEIVEIEKGCRWSGRMWGVNERGRRPGEQTAIFHVGRTDVNPEEDVPEFDFAKDEDVESKQWTTEEKGEVKSYRIEGEIWKNEILLPAPEAKIVFGKDNEEEFNYFVGASGEKESSKKLEDAGKYLWFKPTIVSSVLENRGSELSWYTRDTGRLSAGRNGGVHFGINSLGLINVFAKDIARLPDWQQKMWHAYNVEPDGKVSKELLMSLQEAKPADSLPPEEYFVVELKRLNDNFESKFDAKLIKNNLIEEISDRVHRFKASQKDGLFVLAKDIARLTADSFDRSELFNNLKNNEKTKNLGTLKLMEKLLSEKIGDPNAKKIMSPLFYAYELRISDAHPPSKKVVEEVFKNLSITDEVNDVEKGRILIHECTSSLSAINHYFFAN